jgi:hypothetical protein
MNPAGQALIAWTSGTSDGIAASAAMRVTRLGRGFFSFAYFVWFQCLILRSSSPVIAGFWRHAC